MKFDDLTDNQKVVYNCFKLSGHLYDELSYDWFDLTNTPYEIEEWSDYTGLSTKVIRAVISTLVTAGLIIVNPRDEEGIRWITFTKEGYMMLENILPKEYHDCFVSKKH